MQILAITEIEVVFGSGPGIPAPPRPEDPSGLDRDQASEPESGGGVIGIHNRVTYAMHADETLAKREDVFVFLPVDLIQLTIGLRKFGIVPPIISRLRTKVDY